jgi:hypothetical protein
MIVLPMSQVLQVYLEAFEVVMEAFPALIKVLGGGALQQVMQ